MVETAGRFENPRTPWRKQVTYKQLWIEFFKSLLSAYFTLAEIITRGISDILDYLSKKVFNLSLDAAKQRKRLWA